MTKKLTVLHDSVLIKQTEESNSGGGIMLPDSAKQKPTEGIVIGVGPGARDNNGQIVPMSVKENQRVVYRKWAGTEVKISGEDLMVMKESDIIGIIEE